MNKTNVLYFIVLKKDKGLERDIFRQFMFRRKCQSELILCRIKNESQIQMRTKTIEIIL